MDRLFLLGVVEANSTNMLFNGFYPVLGVKNLNAKIDWISVNRPKWEKWEWQEYTEAGDYLGEGEGKIE